MSENLPTGLYIVPTPIGNLGDISARALQVLESVATIAAEDTRHSRQLLQHFGIATRCISLHQHNENQRAEQLLTLLQTGQSVALISDAGTPLISDPGYRLVSQIKAAGVAVIPLPGACALTTALSAAGLPTERFAFEGFLPPKRGAREKALQALKGESRTLIFYESPKRVLATLHTMQAVFGPNRRACLARELTKLHETILTTTLAELVIKVGEDANQQRGEIVLLVEGDDEPQSADEAQLDHMLEVLLAELPVKKAATVCAKLTGTSKNQAYQRALSLQQSDR